MAPHCLLCPRASLLEVPSGVCDMWLDWLLLELNCWPCKLQDISPAKETALLWGLGGLSLCLQAFRRPQPCAYGPASVSPCRSAQLTGLLPPLWKSMASGHTLSLPCHTQLFCRPQTHPDRGVRACWADLAPQGVTCSIKCTSDQLQPVQWATGGRLRREMLSCKAYLRMALAGACHRHLVQPVAGLALPCCSVSCWPGCSF